MRITIKDVGNISKNIPQSETRPGSFYVLGCQLTDFREDLTPDRINLYLSVQTADGVRAWSLKEKRFIMKSDNSRLTEVQVDLEVTLP